MFLKRDATDLRLRWTGAEGEAPERAVAPGSYRLFGYRVVRGEWMLSTTGGRQELELSAGELRTLSPGQTIHVKPRAQRKGDQLRFNVPVTNGRGMGLTIYQGGERVRLTCSVLDAEGNVLTTAPLRYG